MVKTLSRSAVLARELLAAIARRELLPGDPIDIQALGRQHGVSRTVVREALADLGGKGLVVARPKVGTTVAPASHWNLLDPVLVAVAIAEPDGPGSLLAEALAMRCVIEPALAAAAARDASRAQRSLVLDAIRSLAGAVGSGDRSAHAQADVALHEAIADACANRLLRSADRALAPVRALCRERLHAQPAPAGEPHPEAVRALALQTGLGLAIARRDASAATAWALTLSRLGCLPTTAPVDIALSPAPTLAAAAAVGANRLAATTPASAPSHAVPAATGRQAAALTAATVHRPLPAGVAPVAPRGATSAVPPSHLGTDWPETEMMIRQVGPITPLRRGHLEPDSGSAGADDDALAAHATPRQRPAPDTVAR